MNRLNITRVAFEHEFSVFVMRSDAVIAPNAQIAIRFVLAIESRVQIRFIDVVTENVFERYFSVVLLLIGRKDAKRFQSGKIHSVISI